MGLQMNNAPATNRSVFVFRESRAMGIFDGILEGILNGILQFVFAFKADNLDNAQKPIDGLTDDEPPDEDHDGQQKNGDTADPA